MPVAYLRRAPSSAEHTIFELFASDARRLGTSLAQSPDFRPGQGIAVDLRSAAEVEFVMLSIRTAAKQYLARGEECLTFVERINAMVEAGAAERTGKTQAALHLLRVIATTELLQAEAQGRFSRHAPLHTAAREAALVLARGLIARFGGDLPMEVQRAFPRFSRIVRDEWLPTQKRRRLLLWLTKTT